MKENSESISTSKLIRKGKVKDIYDPGEGKLLFHFTDRVSAFDVILSDVIPRKGEALCKFASYWFNTLPVKNHMLRVLGKDTMLVKKLEIIPVECVVRGYLYGTLFERVRKGSAKIPIEPILASKLPEPILDPTTKFEARDRPISRAEVLSKGWMDEREFELVKTTSISIYTSIAEKADRAGFILADLKLEFAKEASGEILLADSIGPDEFRLWPKDKYVVGKSQESFDKQLIRDYLIQIGYKTKLDEAAAKGTSPPAPPSLPQNLINETTRRYIHAYEKIASRPFED